MDNTSLSRRTRGSKRTNASVDVDALVAEVLGRIGLQPPGGVGPVLSTQEQSCGGSHNASTVTAASTGEAAELSFSGFPQFERCCSAEARSLLAYRYLRANNFDVEDTVAMIIDTNKFRKQHRLDSIMIFPSLIPLRGFTEREICDALHVPMAVEGPTQSGSHDDMSTRDSRVEYLNNHHVLRPIVNLINRYYANSIHYCDKGGHPVVYGRLEHMKINELYRELWRISPLRQRPENLILLFHLYGNELLWRVVQYCGAQSNVLGENPGIGPKESMITATVIVDCMGARLLDYIWGPFPRILREILNLDQRYYPEILHQLLLVNCPKSVAFAHWLSKHLGASKQGLRRKILCVSEEKTPSLLKSLIDEDKLPVFLGGTCQCADGCVPLNESAGGDGVCSLFAPSNSPPLVPPGGGEEGGMEGLFVERREGGPGGWGFSVQKRTENVVVPARRKFILTYEIRAPEDITWEFAVKRGEVGFSAVFVTCSADGHTDVLMPPATVKEAADHFVLQKKGELILTWDNTRSLYSVRKLQLRVHRRAHRVRSPPEGSTSQ